jgi:hypothetical protein
VAAVTITFLTRRGCSLCDETLARLEPLAGRAGVDVAVEDVDDAGLAAEHGERVPVILDRDGRVLAWGRIGDVRLRWSVLRARLGR